MGLLKRFNNPIYYLDNIFAMTLIGSIAGTIAAALPVFPGNRL